MTGGGPERPVRVVVLAVGEVEYAVAGRIARSLPAPAELPSTLHHGEADFPAVDLPAAFGAGLAPGAEPWVFLVEADGVRRALLAERLVGTETIDPEAVQPVPAVYPPAERRRWRGLLPRPDGRVLVLLSLEGLPTVAGPARQGEA